MSDHELAEVHRIKWQHLLHYKLDNEQPSKYSIEIDRF